RISRAAPIACAALAITVLVSQKIGSKQDSNPAGKTGKGRYRKVAAFLLLLPLAWLATSCDSRDVHQWSGQTMGTYYRITLTQLNPGQWQQVNAMADQVDATLANINTVMSTYQAGSELVQFNSLPAGRCQDASESLIVVLRKAAEISRQSQGAFNPLLGPLVDRWNFGPGETPFVLPLDEELSRLRALADWQWISYSEQPAQLCKHRDGVKLDFSAIAKGYAVDRIAEELQRAGFRSYLVDIGGEIKVAGLNARQELWRLAIEKPELGAQQHSAADVQQVVALTNKAVATSGDYRNFFTHQGRHYSHTIDPHSGFPITHGMASVTVIDKSAAVADAWATALLAAGPARGRALAQQYQLAVYFVQRNKTSPANPASDAAIEATLPAGQQSNDKASAGYEVWYSKAFKRYLQQ
ncbi:MAG: FAD:protein FMN transferase, partial [Gammaproteobacteria bacterium]|nr:FAD:protein FMN transferase [Gammaproteobacteria bacterium]